MAGCRGWLPTRGSHRSGLAQLRHPAPRTMVSLLNGTHCERLAPLGEDRFCVGARSGPMSCVPVTSPTKPFAPQPFHFISESVQRQEVAGDAVVRIVTPQLAAQRRLLVAQFPVPMIPAPLANSLQRSAESVLSRLALHNPSPLPGASPIVGEPQHREAALALRTASLRLRRLQNSTIRVLSGCRRRPYFSSRFASTPSTASRHSSCSNTSTASSA